MDYSIRRVRGHRPLRDPRSEEAQWVQGFRVMGYSKLVCKQKNRETMRVCVCPSCFSHQSYRTNWFLLHSFLIHPLQRRCKWSTRTISIQRACDGLRRTWRSMVWVGERYLKGPYGLEGRIMVLFCNCFHLRDVGAIESIGNHLYRSLETEIGWG